MDDYGHIDAGHESADLDHTLAEQGSDYDHGLDSSVYGDATHHESDLHYSHGEAQHYESPHHEELDRQEYTNLDAHEDASHLDFGSHLSEFQNNESFANLANVHQDFDASHLDATRFDGGEGEISAVSK